MLSLGGRLEKWGRIKQATDGDQWDALIARESTAVMEMNEARATDVTRIAGMSLAAEVLTGSSGGDDCCRQCRRVVARKQLGTISGVDTNETLSTRVMIKIIGHTKCRNFGTLRVPLDMPHVIKAITRSGHGAAIHMRTESGGIRKKRLGGPK
jgi:hypothetical protein